MSRIEIFRGQARRRWSDEAKRRLVAETLFKARIEAGPEYEKDAYQLAHRLVWIAPRPQHPRSDRAAQPPSSNFPAQLSKRRSASSSLTRGRTPSPGRR